MGGLRFDPSQTQEDVRQSLKDAAEAAWGAEAVDLRAALDATARAMWLIAQEPALAPGDLEP